MSKRVIYIEVEIKDGCELPTVEALQHVLGMNITVIGIEELEPCWLCHGLEKHVFDCPMQ